MEVVVYYWQSFRNYFFEPKPLLIKISNLLENLIPLEGPTFYSIFREISGPQWTN